MERSAKAATHVGDASTLNVWTTDGPSYLGFATFPSWFKRSPELDGVVLDYKSFVGGAFGDSFSLGKTATHEVGHWLGLLHTFQGGCNAKGDYVADTPAELTPTTGCPAGKNTCSAPGDDPVHNYMDYSFDSCYDAVHGRSEHPDGRPVVVLPGERRVQHRKLVRRITGTPVEPGSRPTHRPRKP